MKEKWSEERRRYVRIDVAAKVNFQVKEREKGKGETPSKALAATSKNVSVEGICFRSESKLEPGTHLDLEIFLPSESEPLLLKGEVKWSNPIKVEGKDKEMFDTGVKLLTLEENDENRYVKYVLDKMMERLSRYLHL